jgi:hypothetical protein
VTVTFGGSLQAQVVRFTLLDDTPHHRAGSELYSEDIYRVSYGRRLDGTLGMRLAFVRPHPIPFRFVFGGDLRYNAAGELAGWSEPGPLRDTRYSIEAYSANIAGGAIIGFYRWSAPECVPVMFAGAALEGQRAAAFRAATTVDLRSGFHLDAVDHLPAYERPTRTEYGGEGFTLVEAA